MSSRCWSPSLSASRFLSLSPHHLRLLSHFIPAATHPSSLFPSKLSSSRLLRTASTASPRSSNPHHAPSRGSRGPRHVGQQQAFPLRLHREAARVSLILSATASQLQSANLPPLCSLLEHPQHPKSLRWLTDDTFEISANEAKAIAALSPKWEFRS